MFSLVLFLYFFLRNDDLIARAAKNVINNMYSQSGKTPDNELVVARWL